MSVLAIMLQEFSTLQLLLAAGLVAVTVRIEDVLRSPDKKMANE